MLSFEDVKSVLIAVQSNPELHQQALKECADLYSEMFVAEDGTFTGSDVLQNLDMNSPCSQYTVEQYLCEIVQLEIDINSIKYELNTDDDAVIYTEIIKREAYRSYTFNMSNNYYDDEDDEDAEDADYISINAQLHDDTPYYQEDYAAEANEYTLRRLVKERYDDLIEKFKNTVYVTLVNYKGECEGESLLIKASHLRKFYSKYWYGN
mgnify:CR=1 FL=1